MYHLSFARGTVHDWGAPHTLAAYITAKVEAALTYTVKGAGSDWKDLLTFLSQGVNRPSLLTLKGATGCPLFVVAGVPPLFRKGYTLAAYTTAKVQAVFTYLSQGGWYD